MQDQAMQASGYQNLHTNSIIQIESDVDSDELVFGWRRLHPTKPYPFNHHQWMQHLGSEYTCTPLDYQCQIELKINYRGEEESFTYGPIKLQPELQKKIMAHKEHEQEQMDARKYRVRITKEPNPYVLMWRNATQHTFTLHAPAQVNLPEIYYVWSSVQDKGMPKVIVPVQSDKLAIWIGKQIGQFVGQDGYLEVLFESRLSRDCFVCEVMECNGVELDIQPKMAIEEEAMMILGDYPRLESSLMFQQCSPEEPPKTAFENEEKKQENGFINIGSLERDVQDLIQSESSNSSPEEMMQDIYEILYTPSASKNISVQVEKSQRVNQNQGGHHLNLPKKKNNQLQKTLKHNEYWNLLNSCRSYSGHINDNNSRDTKSRKNSQIIQESFEVSQPTQYQNSRQFYIKPPSNIYLDPNNINLCQTRQIRQDPAIRQSKQKIQLQSETNVSFHNISQNSKDLTLEEKITYLTKLNMYLLEENQRLKEENKQLKANQAESAKNQTSKLRQIRKTISQMANRIAYLEGFTDANYRISKAPPEESKSLFKQKPRLPAKLEFARTNKTIAQKNQLMKGKKAPPVYEFRKGKKEDSQQMPEKQKETPKKPYLFKKGNWKNNQSPQKNVSSPSPLLSVQSQKAFSGSNRPRYPNFLPDSRRGTQASSKNATMQPIKQPSFTHKQNNFLSMPKTAESIDLQNSPGHLSFGGKR